MAHFYILTKPTATLSYGNILTLGAANHS